jgi:hypothetical protein
MRWRALSILMTVALLAACQGRPRKASAPPTQPECLPHDMRLVLGQGPDGRLVQQAAAISRCAGRTFTDPQGRQWTTDDKGHVAIPRPLDEAWITWPTEPTRFIDMALAFWLAEQGHHFLAVRQMISNLLHSGILQLMRPHFCSWWGRARAEGGTWEKMMAALPLVACRTGEHLVAASPRHGFLMRLPAAYGVQTKPLDGDTSLFVVTGAGGGADVLLLLASEKESIPVETLLALPADVQWIGGKDAGTRTARLRGVTWSRRDEQVFGQTQVWLATGGMRDRLDELPTRIESFSMVDPCPATETPEPVEP